jgi:hypothetical protein
MDIDYEFDYSSGQAARTRNEIEIQQQAQQQQQIGGLPGLLSARIIRFLGNFVEPDLKGWIFGLDTEFK